MTESEFLLEAAAVTVDYTRRGRETLRAVDGVSLHLRPGEILGLVGESGCGKSTLGRALVGITPLAGGQVTFGGSAVAALTRRARPARLRALQMIFQDPYASLNPRRRVGDQIADGLRLRTSETANTRVGASPEEVLERVGLTADAVRRYPHEFSGGQRQRVAIARALAAGPTCLIADEPISALDASAQAQVANLLATLVRELNVAMLFISHDLAVVRQIADRTAVMYLGRVVETGRTHRLWSHPVHPYTRALIEAVPRADGLGRLPSELPGDVPDPTNPPTGCRFHPRCPIAEPGCSAEDPTLIQIGSAPEAAAACLVRAPAPGRSPDLVTS